SALPEAGEAGRNLHIPELHASPFDTFPDLISEGTHKSLRQLHFHTQTFLETQCGFEETFKRS
ncbi:hypothetical protein, partial [Rubritalea sp.]|uniref:hypothetical protein n=1 Tax=Rubritalea sp. TaxID=2109375 RepID=UPI003EF6202D